MHVPQTNYQQQEYNSDLQTQTSCQKPVNFYLEDEVSHRDNPEAKPLTAVETNSAGELRESLKKKENTDTMLVLIFSHLSKF